MGLQLPTEWGGQGLPWTVATAVWEMWNSANLAFCLCPILTQAGVELLLRHGTEAQRARYLPKLVSGEWTGTMCLTEPQAGSDVGALRTRAVPEGDHYRIRGTKIFITYGDHDLTENTIHMVLARTQGAPAGTRGISLFLVPKFLVEDDGTLGAPNDLRCVSLEHKLGIHGSPTCVMSFGDGEGAVGWLVGQEQGGMQAMFTMMNNARLSVGLEGLALAERAYQRALAYARERVQGRRRNGGAEAPARIVEHPDVRRMLVDDEGRRSRRCGRSPIRPRPPSIARSATPTPTRRAEADGRLALLIPLVKAWCTDLGFEIASTALQVHGGMGYIEETGIAQHLRDARIAMIYEGTNGIQALDLVGRKLQQAEGQLPWALFAELRRDLRRARGHRRGWARGLARGGPGRSRGGDPLAAGRARQRPRRRGRRRHALSAHAGDHARRLSPRAFGPGGAPDRASAGQRQARQRPVLREPAAATGGGAAFGRDRRLGAARRGARLAVAEQIVGCHNRAVVVDAGERVPHGRRSSRP